MKSRLDLMVDIETLSTTPDATIIQIAAVGFNIITGQEITTFNQYANISKNKDMVVSGSTLKWWLETNPKLLLEIIKKQDQSSEVVLIKFYNWIKDLHKTYSIYFWGNGLSFDSVLIKTNLEKIGLSYPFSYRNERDLRTLVELASHKLRITDNQLKEKFKDSMLTAHDGLDDCRYQIVVASYCYGILEN